MRVFIYSLFVLLSFQLVQAAPASSEIPYYGEQFYRDLSTGTANNDLKMSIKKVLRSYHLRVDGSYDQIVNNCSGSGCYSQISLGYNGARVVLMGNLFLTKYDDGSYGVRDVYCDADKTPKDFGGRETPAPDRIPNADIINTEHTWPQSRFSGKHDKGTQKADLHHLFPTDTKINSIRGNNNFGEVGRDTKRLDCPSSRYGVSTKGYGDVFEPPQNHRGNVARALFYFSLRYDLPIDPTQEAFLRKWSKEDPVDEDEIHRNDEIFKAQGNRNPFIDFANLEDRINDF